MGLTLSFAQPTPPAALPITVGTTAGHRKKQSPAPVPGGVTLTPPPVPTISTPTPRVATPLVLNVEKRGEEDPTRTRLMALHQESYLHHI